MASPKKINLGVFAAGEIPFPFIHTFKDSSGAVIDLTGWSASVTMEGPGSGSYGAGSIVITDAANGEVTYTWPAADFVDVGNYKMLIWVSDGTNRLASDLVVYTVYDGPGTTPT